MFPTAFSLLPLLASLASTAPTIPSASPFARRAVLAHDAVVSFPQSVPAGDVGNLMLKFQPKLKVVNGCVPFPGVDADGNTNGGLSPTGSPSGGCSSSTGQVYARSTTTSTGALAIMYSWYMPKDSPSSGLGHRHEWENVVVFLSSSNPSSATVTGMSVSQHGGYEKSSSPNLENGETPLVGYVSYWPVNHQLVFTGDVGGQQPLVAWDSLTDAAKSALENTDFVDAAVPFRDGRFLGNVAEAVI